MVKGPFTWKEDDPSTRIILESSFGLHAKARLLGSTLNLVYMKFTCKNLCSARLQSKMAGEKDKKLLLGVLPYLLALITAFQHSALLFPLPLYFAIGSCIFETILHPHVAHRYLRLHRLAGKFEIVGL